MGHACDERTLTGFPEMYLLSHPHIYSVDLLRFDAVEERYTAPLRGIDNALFFGQCQHAGANLDG
jgi:hypothetical protein